jgi:hypothetical protein
MAQRFTAQTIDFNVRDLAFPLAVRVRDEEATVNLLGWAWNARAPGWGTKGFYERRFLSLARESGETIDAYFLFTPREWALPLAFGWDHHMVVVGLLCWQIEVWYEGNDAEDTPGPEEMPDREALHRALFG